MSCKPEPSWAPWTGMSAVIAALDSGRFQPSSPPSEKGISTSHSVSAGLERGCAPTTVNTEEKDARLPLLRFLPGNYLFEKIVQTPHKSKSFCIFIHFSLMDFTRHVMALALGSSDVVCIPHFFILNYALSLTISSGIHQ